MRAQRGDQVRFQQLHSQTGLGPGWAGGRGSWPHFEVTASSGSGSPRADFAPRGTSGHVQRHLWLSLLGLLNILRHPGRPHDAEGRRPGSQRCPGRRPSPRRWWWSEACGLKGPQLRSSLHPFLWAPVPSSLPLLQDEAQDGPHTCAVRVSGTVAKISARPDTAHRCVMAFITTLSPRPHPCPSGSRLAQQPEGPTQSECTTATALWAQSASSSFSFCVAHHLPGVAMTSQMTAPWTELRAI